MKKPRAAMGIQRRSAAELLTHDEARRIAANIAKAIAAMLVSAALH